MENEQDLNLIIIEQERILLVQLEELANMLQLKPSQELIVSGQVRSSGCCANIRFHDHHKRRKVDERQLSSDELAKINRIEFTRTQRALVDLFLKKKNKPIKRHDLMIEMHVNGGTIDQVNRILKEKGLPFALRATAASRNLPHWEQQVCFVAVQN